MKKKPTIYDIAKELNITISTVSRALNNSALISIETKNAVWKAAKEMNYRPNKLASSLSLGKTQIIGIIIPSAQIHFFSLVINSLERNLSKEGYKILFYQSNESYESELNGVRTLLEAQVDGIIISPSLETYDFAHLTKVHQEGVPIIVFDRVNDLLDLPSVSINDVRAGYIATKHLIEKGYKRIGYISTNSTIKIFADRLNGHRLALAEFGYSYDDSLTILNELSIDAGIKGTEKLMKLKIKPDAIIGGDDFTALGIIKQLSKLGISAPKIGVIGFANQIFSEFITPSLSTIDQQAELMGNECANLFKKVLNAKSLESFKEKIVLNPILIERESTLK